MGFKSGSTTAIEAVMLWFWESPKSYHDHNCDHIGRIISPQLCATIENATRPQLEFETFITVLNVLFYSTYGRLIVGDL